MPDYRDPAQLVKDECVYTFTAVFVIENMLNLSFLKSYASEILACRRWYLYVRPCGTNPSFHAYHATQSYTSSWEFLISLDLEWDVIRGRRSYQRTFWVCNDGPFFPLLHSEPISVVDRFTSLPDLQPSRLL